MTSTFSIVSFPHVFKTFLFFSSLVFFFLEIVLAGEVQCFENNKLCFQATFVANNPNLVDVNIYTSLNRGWIGFGLGSTMRQANVFMFWKSTPNSWTISERTSSSLNTPTPKSVNSFVSFNGQNPVTRQGYQWIQFQTHANSGFEKLAFVPGSIPMIYAYYEGETPVSASSIPVHDGDGHFNYNIGSVPTATNSSPNTYQSSGVAAPVAQPNVQTNRCRA
ncbi:hypothetical protein HMI54_005162 [Coelomomyces lativittatus]|nr:hypothetical protein HMI54_005162 [Coelomomyces lativittatus]KAJ1506608.1 hypothetical protein HMI55_001103 [Coelomomyces lativittatus]KAJ1509055.1 hypothetical protein HMI56_006988 [Coelomomyces lativittatus]